MMSDALTGVSDEANFDAKASTSSQPGVWALPSGAAETLDNNGFFVAPPPLSSADFAAIKRELADWNTTPAVNGYGCIFSAGDALLQNLALYSPAAFKAALSEDMLDFMARAFGQPAILAKIEYRRAVETKAEMPLHCDPGHDISVYIYLDGVDRDRGSTYLIPGTQHIGTAMNDGYVQVPDAARAKVGGEAVYVEGPPGVCLFFRTNIWHGRSATVRPGREILWLSYVPKDCAGEGLNLVVPVNVLKQLSPRQIEALGTGTASARKSGEDFRLSHALDAASLNLVPLPYLIRTVARRTLRATYHGVLPRGLRQLVGKALAVVRPGAAKRHYTKISAEAEIR